MQNTVRSHRNASEKEKVSGQTYRLPIWNGMLEHCAKIKDAIWLLLLYIDWTTEEVEAGAGRSADRGGTGGLVGVVRGGIVVSDGITAKEIPGTTRKTTLRWRERLASHEFIRQDRKNYGYVIRVLKSKKWDADGAKGTFRIPVSTGIFDHYKKLKSSIWLLFWYIDKTTVEENGYGHVLGGKPVLDSVPAKVLGVSNDTIAAWRENLERHGCIRARRTPYGHVISVAKSKKWVGKKPSEMSQNPESQMSQNSVSLKNSTSEMSRFDGSDVPISPVRCPNLTGEMSQNSGNKEDIAVDFTETEQGQDSARPEVPTNPPQKPKPSNRENRKKESSRARMPDMPESWLRFSRVYADLSGKFPKTGEARWQKLEILLQQYTDEEIEARLKAWCLKRTDRDMSWAVDDFLGGEVHVTPLNDEYARVNTVNELGPEWAHLMKDPSEPQEPTPEERAAIDEAVRKCKAVLAKRGEVAA